MSTRRLSDDDFSEDFPKWIGRPANAALVARGIRTLDQVALLTEAELLQIHGVGPKAVRLLKAELDARGQQLAH